MRFLLPVILLLAGCATSPDSSPVEPQSVAIRFLDEGDWFEHTNELMLAGNTWSMPYDVQGSADWKGDTCIIYLPSGEEPTEYTDTLAHELRHCQEGPFHR